jgi:hypothetical protein
MSEWRWWEQPILRFRKFVGASFSAHEPLMPQIEMREILMKRELWFAPQEKERNSVSGIPGARWIGESDGWIFPAWRCQSCNKVLIVGAFSDLKHECMKQA